MIQTKLNINEIIKAYEKKHGPIENDGHYGEQCNFEDALDILLEMTITFPLPRRVWESSKQVLDDVKEVEIWTKWKCR